MNSTRNRVVRSASLGLWGMVLLIVGPLLHGCASSGKGGDTGDDPRRPALQRAIDVDVSCEGERLFGTRKEWLDDLTRVLAEERVAEVVRSRDDPARPPGDADLSITIVVRSKKPLEPEVETQSAVLDFFTWSTLPILPWWIGDVDLDPGIVLEVRRSLRDWDASSPWGEPERLDLKRLKTSLRERQPILSWSTLGAIFVPPFVFDGTDAEHLEASVGPVVREEAARRVAALVEVSAPPLDIELLDNIRFERRISRGASTGKSTEKPRAVRETLLVFDAATDLTEVQVGLADLAEKDWVPKVFPPGAKKGGEKTFNLVQLLPKVREAKLREDPWDALRGKTIRIVARGDNRAAPLRYSIHVPEWLFPDAGAIEP